MLIGNSRLLVRLPVLLAVLSVYISAPSIAVAGEKIVQQQPAKELLQDGLDALAADQDDLARQLFKHLRTSYPGTAEAGRAGLELDQMDGDWDKSARDGVPSSGSQPAERMSELRRAFLIDVGDRVFFAENSASLGGRARTVIENQVRWLKTQNELMITLIGRSDDGGTAADALDLSTRRAEAVRARLVEGGISPSRIFVEGRGDRDLLTTCKTPICQAQNRHTESLIGDAGLLRGGAASSQEWLRSDQLRSGVAGDVRGPAPLASAPVTQ